MTPIPTTLRRSTGDLRRSRLIHATPPPLATDRPDTDRPDIGGDTSTTRPGDVDRPPAVAPPAGGREPAEHAPDAPARPPTTSPSSPSSPSSLSPSGAGDAPDALVRRLRVRRDQTALAPLGTLGDRIGIAHTRSTERRPSTLVSRSLAAGPAATPAAAPSVPTRPAARTASPSIVRRTTTAGIVRREESATARPVHVPGPPLGAAVPSGDEIHRSDGSSTPARESATPPAGRDPGPGHDLGPSPNLVRPGSLFAVRSDAVRRRSVVAPGPGALERVARALRPAAPPTPTTPATPTTATPTAGTPTAATPTAGTSTAGTPTTGTSTAVTALPATAPGPPGPPARPGTDSAGGGATVARALAGGASPTDTTSGTASLADRFLHELNRRPPARPRPLPEPLAPIARLIAPTRRVMVSSDPATRRALRSVGKVAATTDDVIHLDRAPTRPDARTTAVIAHELTHVAHPSPVARFFDDDDRGPEERRAEQVARIMARAPLAPNSPVGRRDGPDPAGRGSTHRPTGRGDGAGGDGAGGGTTGGPGFAGAVPAGGRDRIVRRSPARPTPARRSPGTVSASELAARLAGESAAARAARSPQVSRSSTTTIRRFDDGRSSSSTGTSSDSRSGQTDHLPEPTDPWEALETPEGRQWFREQLADNMEVVLRALEDHVIVELERRGGRGWRSL